ncbi:MAG: HEAT repeat domain-containing protein [Myxococcota bacterium]|nr:HEAT repeat domain-containing protein [Myxococcota bacterium]
MRNARLAIPLLAAISIGIAAPRAAAQDLTLDRATQMLRSNSHDEVMTAIQSLGMLGSPRAVEPLAARIRDGLAPDLLESAIDTLTVLGRPEAGPVLYELTSHRRPEVRLRAVQAIAATRPRGAERALVSALSDSSAEVRGAAAIAIGELGATGAIDSLFLAFDRGVPEAGPALGRLARPEHVGRVLDYLGRVSFSQMSAVLGELLARRELPARARLDVIARLGELATPEVRTFLESWIESQQPPANDPVRRAAEDVIARIAQ